MAGILSGLITPADAVSYEENEQFCIVKVHIRNLTVQKSLFGGITPKAGESSVDVKFNSWGFELNASLKGRSHTVHHKIKKLPAEIIPDQSYVKYKKHLVILFLKKRYNSVWAAKLQAGLEHEYSEDSDDIVTESIDPDIYNDYLNAIKDGKEEDTSQRVMIIGCYGQGKTTLARRLMSDGLEGVESTNGIDIYTLSYKQDENEWNSLIEEDPLKETIKRLVVASATKIEDKETEKQDMEEEGIETTITEEIIYSRINPTTSYVPKDEHSLISQQKLMNYSVVKDGLSLFQKLKQEVDRSNSTTATRKLSLWDFGGQFVFYATHQLFHSRNAVYLLVFDLNKDINSLVHDEDYPGGTHPVVKTMKDYIEFWVTSVHSYVGSEDSTQPQIILVGTHKDKISNEDIAEGYIERIREMFDDRLLRHHIHDNWFAVDGTDLADGTVDLLRKEIIEVGRMKRKKEKEFIPASWMIFEYSLRQRKYIVKFEDVMKLDKELGNLIGSEHKMKSFLKFHHSRGTYIYFDENELAEFVVLKPAFIVDAFKCILTSEKFCKKDKVLRPLWRKLTTEAILEPELVHNVWNTEGNENFIQFKDVLLAILKRHKIISEAKKFDERTGQLSPGGYYIVPSFLRKPKQNEIEEFIRNRHCTTVSLVYVFKNEAVVTTVYQRITGAAIGSFDVVELNGNSLLFENAGVYFLDQRRHAGVISFAENKIELQAVPLCIEENIEPKVTDFFRRFVENVIRNEFTKLQSLGGRDVRPFELFVRCQHSYHSLKGSKSLYDIGELKEKFEKHAKKIVSCPDNAGHESITIEGVFHEWFSREIIVDEVRRDLLTRQELSLLSTAIGAEWKILGGLLGVHKVDIDHIEEENIKISVRIFEMLGKWQKEKEEHATLDVLVREIKKLSPDSVKTEVLQNVINKIY